MSSGVPEIIAAIKEGRIDESAIGSSTGFAQGPPFDEPLASPGSSSATFRHDSEDGSSRAIRVFHTSLPGEESLYRMEMIADEVDRLGEGAGFRIAPLEVHRDAVHLPSTSLPAIVMPWIEGFSIHRCAREAAKRGDKKTLGELISRAEKMAAGMSRYGFDHGDISGSNIIVDHGGDLWLIDPDTLRHSSIEDDDFHLREVGHEHFAHTKRSCLEWEENLFRFPLELIIVSLKGLEADPDLVNRFGNEDNSLLFKREDLDEPYDSELFKVLIDLVGKRANLLKMAAQSNSVTVANKILGPINARVPKTTPLGGLVLPESPLCSVGATRRSVRIGKRGLPLRIPEIMDGEA